MSKKLLNQDSRGVKTYTHDDKPDLKKTDQLLYHYLLSISTYDYQCGYYRVKKDKVVQIRIAETLKMSKNTVPVALKRIIAANYVVEDGNYYLIPLKTPYVPLDIKLIRTLIQFGSLLPGSGKHIVSLYCLVYLMVQQSKKDEEDPNYSVYNIAMVFENRNMNKPDLACYYLMFAIFEFLGVMSIEKTVKKVTNNKTIETLRIKDVKLALEDEIILEQIENDKDTARILSKIMSEL